ncbi:MAG TPA: hypothetical protein VF442_11285, partial [Sphingobium sp.]
MDRNGNDAARTGPRTVVLAAFLLVFNRGREGAPWSPIINFRTPKPAFGEGWLRAYRSADDMTGKELG